MWQGIFKPRLTRPEGMSISAGCIETCPFERGELRGQVGCFFWFFDFIYRNTLT